MFGFFLSPWMVVELYHTSASCTTFTRITQLAYGQEPTRQVGYQVQQHVYPLISLEVATPEGKEDEKKKELKKKVKVFRRTLVTAVQARTHKAQKAPNSARPCKRLFVL